MISDPPGVTEYDFDSILNAESLESLHVNVIMAGGVEIMTIDQMVKYVEVIAKVGYHTAVQYCVIVFNK